jgi:integrase
MLHRALSDAVAWRYLSYNPADHASLPRTPRGTRKQARARTWTIEQLVAWLTVARRDRDAGVWVLAATTGMRRSELAGLRREFLDLAAALLTIEPTRVVVAGKAEDSDGKTDTSQRTISLDPFTVEALRVHLSRLDEEAAAFGPSYDSRGLLICHPDGRPLHPDTITRRFNHLVDQADVPRIHLHDVRHTYATACIDAGINPKTVSDRIGHANMAFTMSAYTHRSSGEDQAAAEAFARLITAALS